MPKSSVPKKQLKKLQSAGLFTGKLPRGNKLTPYQRGLITRFNDVATGKATVLKPKNPSTFKNIFKVQGDKVIVPKGKGETWRVTKSGAIERTRKGPRGEQIKFKSWRQKKPGELPPQPPPEKRVRYALPFARKVAKGEYRLEWQRFPTYEALANFMKAYEETDPVTNKARYGDWAQYVFEESIDDERSIAERNRALNEAAVKYGKAKDTSIFESSNTLEPIMRVARKARRQKSRRTTRGH